MRHFIPTFSSSSSFCSLFRSTVFMLICLSIIFSLNQISSILSLKCLGAANPTAGWSDSCGFSVGVGDALPTLSDVQAPPISCAMVEADAKPQNDKDDGTCYGHVKLEYPFNRISYHLTAVKRGLSRKHPYHSMMGAANGENMVARMEARGSLNNDRLELRLRFQCKSADNCAWEILQQFFSSNIAAQARLNAYKNIQKVFGHGKNAKNPNLKCYTDPNDEIVNCTATQNRCEFLQQTHKNKDYQRCTTKNSTVWQDFSFTITGGYDTTKNPPTMIPIQSSAYFLCSTDLCNSDTTFIEMLKHINLLFSPSATGEKPQIAKSTIIDMTASSFSQTSQSGVECLINPSVPLMVTSFIVFKVFS